MRAAQRPVGGDSPAHRLVAAVAIGRNEGERLRRCLASLKPQVALLVYVDSGSTDGSPVLAAELGATVIALDRRLPFTAARARNEGFARVLQSAPQVRYVQFVDGDCEVVSTWLNEALTVVEAEPGVAAVCGRRRERFPAQTVYNTLCDLEWDTPVGEARAFGGDALVRVEALRQADGYRADLVAGEEPELGVRLRAKGWRICRIEAEMTIHDAAMTSFRQWWKRTLRGGLAFAQGAYLHGRAPERFWVRETLSACGWGLVLPIVLALASGPLGAWSVLGFAAYPLQVLRLYLRGSGRFRERALRAVFLVLGKLPEALGVLRFLALRVTGRMPNLIEYK